MLEKSQYKGFEYKFSYCFILYDSIVMFSTMEKIQLSDTNFSSINIGAAANGEDFDLYYAAMILVDDAICM